MANANAATMAIVAEIFAAFPGRFRFTSGRRTAAQNAAVGGVRNSFHLTGQAADFVAINGRYPPGEKGRIGSIVARYGYQVIFHNAGSGNHYHIEPAPNGGRVNRSDEETSTNGGRVNRSGEKTSTNDGETSTSTYMLYGLGFVVLYLLISD